MPITKINKKGKTTMHKFPTLYKRTSTGAIQQWTIIAEDGAYYTESGQVGGVITTSKKTFCERKNVGRANETTAQEQAFAEAQAKWQKKIEREYTDKMEEVDKAKDRNFRPMLAHKYEDHVDSVRFPVIGQPKLDGIRCIFTAEGAFSREGKSLCNVQHIQEILELLFEKFPELILDGELYNHELKDEFEKICSIVKKQKVSIADRFEAADKIKYYVYDCPQISQLTMKNCWWDRFMYIKDQFERFNIGDPVVLVPFVDIQNVNEIKIQHDKWVDEGYEGLMLRVASGPYEQKRSKKLLKVKVFDDSEFPIVDVLPGRGNKASMAARVVCRLSDGRTFKAGIIGSEEYATWLLDNKEDIIGAPATVKHFRFTKDGIPRFPKMKVIRDYE